MLRIVWILPGGCVLLAILVLALAFAAPDRSHSQLMPNVALMRIAMIELPEHPESRQFLALGAIRRTNELNRLSELLDTQGTADSPLAAPLLANRSDSDRSDSNPEANNYETDWNLQPRAPASLDVSGSPSVQAVVAIPNEKQPAGTQEEKPAIATLEETSVAIREERPTVATQEGNPTVTIPDSKKSAITRTPPRVNLRNESRAKGVQQVRIRARPPVKQEPPSPQYFFELFGSQQSGQTSPVNNTNYFAYQQPRQTPVPSANNYFVNQRTGSTRTPNARAPVKQESPSPQYFFEPFGSQQTGQTSAVNNTNYFGYQQPRQTPAPQQLFR